MRLDLLWQRQRVWMALLIAAVLVGLSGGSREARAQTTTYTIIAIPHGLGGGVACIGEEVTFQVLLYEYFEGKTTLISQMLRIEALNTGGRGSFSRSSTYVGSNPLAPQAAIFVYNPDSEGQETVYFETSVPPNISLEDAPIYASSAPINFTVDDCPYEVEAVYRHDYQDANGRIAFFGLIPVTQLTGEGLFGEQIYSADSTFIGHYTTWFPQCVMSVSDLETAADIVAVPEGDSLLVTVTYEPTEVTGHISCPGTSGSGTAPVDVNSVNAMRTFRVPMSGGSQTNVISAYGEMTMTVTRRRGGS